MVCQYETVLDSNSKVSVGRFSGLGTIFLIGNIFHPSRITPGEPTGNLQASEQSTRDIYVIPNAVYTLVRFDSERSGPCSRYPLRALAKDGLANTAKYIFRENPTYL